MSMGKYVHYVNRVVRIVRAHTRREEILHRVERILSQCLIALCRIRTWIVSHNGSALDGSALSETGSSRVWIWLWTLRPWGLRHGGG